MRPKVVRDPTIRARPGCYMTDGVRLVEIRELDSSGAGGEDVLNGHWVEIDPLDLIQKWRPVTPAA